MVLIVLDAGYDIVRPTWLLADLPVHLLGRIRCDRVMHAPAPPARRDDKPGRPPRHGDRFAFAEPATWNTADQELTATHTRYGTLLARAFDRLHPSLERRGVWAHHTGQLPIVEGTVIHISVERLPRRARSQTAVAVVQSPRPQHRAPGPAVAQLPAPVRPRAHLPSLGVSALWHDVVRTGRLSRLRGGSPRVWCSWLVVVHGCRPESEEIECGHSR